MFPDSTPTLSLTDVLELLAHAKKAEQCRDIESLRSILQSVWIDYDCLPSVESYPPEVGGEVFRLCGFFLTFYGRSQNKINYQSKAKDLLTNAIEIFESLDLADKVAEAKIILAFCFWNTGEVKETEAILDLVDAEFGENRLHPVYLQAQINRLLILTWAEDYEAGEMLISRIAGAMELSQELTRRAMFHSEAAIICRRRKSFKSAAFHFSEAVRLAGKTNNQRFIALNLNNLALLYRDLKDFPRAHKFADKALKNYSELGDAGMIPHVMDTKALIFVDEGKHKKALETIERAIKLFRTGEDTNGLLDALWTRVRCLLALRRNETALLCFGELQAIAYDRVGETAANKFSRLLNTEIYVLKKLPLDDEVHEFRKSRIRAALIEANFVISRASRQLGLKHQTLSDILKNQFPELYDELGFKRRRRKGENKTENAGGRSVMLRTSDIREEREISRLDLTGKLFGYNFNFRGEIEPFYFDKFYMQKLGVDSDAVVAVVPEVELKEGKFALALDNDNFVISQIQYDEYSRIYFIIGDDGDLIPIDEHNLIGTPVGYCRLADTDQDIIKFTRLAI